MLFEFDRFVLKFMVPRYSAALKPCRDPQKQKPLQPIILYREFLHAQATGGFAGPGSLTITTPAGTIELTEEDGGSVSLSGSFVRDDGAALPSSTSVFIYTENTAQPDDFIRGQEALDPSTGAFSTVVADIPAGSSRLFLSFVVVDPAEALDPAGADTAFALDVVNSACVPSLTITLEWSGDTSDVDLYVTEPGGAVVFYASRFGVSAVLTEGAWARLVDRGSLLPLAGNWGS